MTFKMIQKQVNEWCHARITSVNKYYVFTRIYTNHSKWQIIDNDESFYMCVRYNCWPCFYTKVRENINICDSMRRQFKVLNVSFDWYNVVPVFVKWSSNFSLARRNGKRFMSMQMIFFFNLLQATFSVVISLQEMTRPSIIQEFLFLSLATGTTWFHIL